MNLPDDVIAAAIRVAAQSPCRSKRGVVAYHAFSQKIWWIAGVGHNGPPASIGCPGREVCAGTCGKRSVHAEVRALRDVRTTWPPEPLDLVHVELGPNRDVVPCGGPSCWQCAREILDVGFISGVWLYEVVSEEHCPHLVDLRRVDCPLCQGEACDLCHPGAGRPRCDHDVLDRHHGHPIVNARWRRYTAEEFYRVTLERCGMVP